MPTDDYKNFVLYWYMVQCCDDAQCHVITMANFKLYKNLFTSCIQLVHITTFCNSFTTL